MLLEAVMLICFGVAWPFANLRMLRTGRAEGKGMAFTAIILCGYIAGALAKLAWATSAYTLPRSSGSTFSARFRSVATCCCNGGWEVAATFLCA